MGTGFSPLDERLELLPGQRFTPRLVEGMVRLGAALPFGQVPALIAHFTGVRVGVETVRRLSEAAGAAQLACEEAELARVRDELPDAPAGPAVQQLGLDGAMVPLVGGEWAEVKTLAIGTIEFAEGDAAGQASRTTALSYCSRLSDAASFGQTITLETHRRGTLASGRWWRSMTAHAGSKRCWICNVPRPCVSWIFRMRSHICTRWRKPVGKLSIPTRAPGSRPRLRRCYTARRSSS